MIDRYNRGYKENIFTPVNIIGFIVILADAIAIILGFYFAIRNNVEVDYPEMSYDEVLVIASDTNDTTILTDLEGTHLDDDLKTIKIIGNYKNETENTDFEVFVTNEEYWEINKALVETDQNKILLYVGRKPDDNKFVEFLIKNRYSSLTSAFIGIAIVIFVNKRKS